MPMPRTRYYRETPALGQVIMGTTTDLQTINRAQARMRDAQRAAAAPAPARPAPVYRAPAPEVFNPHKTPRWAVGYGMTIEQQRALRGLDGLSRLGEMSPEAKQVIVSAPAIAGGVLTSAATAATAAATAAGTAAPAWATLAIPVFGPIIAGVTIALTLLLNRKGPKQKVATTEIVNEIEPLLKENVEGYLAGPATAAAQAQALENFDGAWQWVLENCDTPAMGEPGQRCINDRKAGACKFKEGGECWNWFVGYRDPIAKDPRMKPAGGAGSGAGTDSAGGGAGAGSGAGSGLGAGTIAGIPMNMLLIGGAAILALAVLGSGDGSGSGFRFGGSRS